MDKFLRLIESNTPEKDLDKLISGKNELASYLSRQDIKTTPKVFSDVIEIFANDKRYILELIDVIPIQAEDDEASDLVGMTREIAKSGGPRALEAEPVVKQADRMQAGIIQTTKSKLNDMEKRINAAKYKSIGTGI